MLTDKINKKTVVLYLPSLDIGGAERQVLELTKGLDKSRWNVLILTNFINTVLFSEISNVDGIKFILLEKNNKLVYPFRLLSTLYREKPHIVCSYLLSAQMYTLLVRIFLPRTKFIFCIRDALDYSVYLGAKGKYFRWLIEKSIKLVDHYIFNSVAGRKERSCFPDEKVRVIPNGIDTNKYYPDTSRRYSLRQEAGIGENAPVVGIVSNFSMYKGYETFIMAARNVVEQMPDVHFIAIGNYGTPLGGEMRSLVNELGLSAVFHFLGPRTDVPKLLPGMDILCSSSVTEGFSNSICEGMSSGIPCVVTDVGDSALIVGNTGIVVPVGNPGLLANGILKLLNLSPAERKGLGIESRKRIEENFSVSRMVAETEKVFESLLKWKN